jgi:hypothetical protein
MSRSLRLNFLYCFIEQEAMAHDEAALSHG